MVRTLPPRCQDGIKKLLTSTSDKDNASDIIVVDRKRERPWPDGPPAALLTGSMHGFLTILSMGLGG